MMARIIQCAHCKTYENFEETMYFTRKGAMIGVWPLYYFGASQYHPDKAEYYFCGVDCAWANYIEKRKRDGNE